MKHYQVEAEDTQVTISSYARMVEDIEVSDQEKLNQLFPFHIWTENFTEERLKWKRKNPLHIMLLRVYPLDQPFQITDRTSLYWLQVMDSSLGIVPDDSAMTPVLNEEEFAAQVAEIKRTLAKIR